MNRRRVLTQVLLYFFLLMLLTATFGCTNNGYPVPATATDTTYSISGMVALTGGGGPLTDVKVTLSGYETGTYTTGADGTFIFNDLKNGRTYTLTPILAGYTFNPASKVVVINGSNITADFVATSFTGATYSISGKVTGAEELNVKITFSSGSTIAEVLTNADGTYTSPSLPAGGPYTVTPYRSGNAFTPPNIPDIMLNANSTGNNFTAESANFTQADLEGTWNFQSVETGSWNGWVRGTVMIASDGTVTFESCLNSDSACSPASVVFTIDSMNGVIADSGNADNHYTMASNKTFIAGKQYNVGTTHPALIIFQKKLDGTVYANTDLWSKSFVFHQLNVGLSNKWQYGAGSTSSTGAINISSQTDPYPSGTTTPGDVGATISVDSSGVVSMSDNTTWKGFLSADKRTIVGTVTEGTEYHMRIIQIIDGQSSNYMRIVGASPGYMLATTGTTDPAPFWAYQLIGITGGVMSSLDWVCSNSAVTPPGTKTISVSSSGAVTSTDSDFNGQLSYDAKFMVATETFDTGVFALDVIMY
ncbi:MAG: hypothetical protein ABSF13_11395 [Smithella sp.]|jgi:hypothetical protein